MSPLSSPSKVPNWKDALVAVLVLGLSAAVVLPTIQGAQIRAQTAKVHNDLHAFARALELYRADWRDVPPGWNDVTPLALAPLVRPHDYRQVSPFPLKEVDPFMPMNQRRDGQAAGNEEGHYLYFHLNGSWADRQRLPQDKRTNTYILESQGPDRIQDFVPQFAAGTKQYGPEQIYDPSNGLVSNGDIAFWGWEPPANPLARQVIPQFQP